MILKLPEFGRFRPWTTGQRLFPGPAQTRAYWETLRQQGAIPARADLDPRGMGGVLDRVFLAERIGKGLVQVRIAGSALSEVAGMDLRGLPLSCLFKPEARPLLAEALEPVALGQTLTELDLSTGGALPEARLVLLPLTDTEDRRLVLGCLGFDAPHPQARKGFAILQRRDERLDPTPAPPPALPLRRAGHLTLVHTQG